MEPRSPFILSILTTIGPDFSVWTTATAAGDRDRFHIYSATSTTSSGSKIVKATSPRLTSSSAILVFRRRKGSGSILAVAPRTSCLARLAATIIRRNCASIPGHSSATAGTLAALREDFLDVAILDSPYTSLKSKNSARRITDFKPPSGRYRSDHRQTSELIRPSGSAGPGHQSGNRANRSA